MPTIQDVMTRGVECARENETLAEAATKLRDLDVGAMPICGDDERLHGMITDRDIVTRCVADGADPASVKVKDLAQGTPVWVDVSGSLTDALRLMAEHRVRRLPVIDDHRLVGIISQADIARNCSDDLVGDLVKSVSQNS